MRGRKKKSIILQEGDWAVAKYHYTLFVMSGPAVATNEGRIVIPDLRFYLGHVPTSDIVFLGQKEIVQRFFDELEKADARQFDERQVLRQKQADEYATLPKLLAAQLKEELPSQRAELCGEFRLYVQYPWEPFVWTSEFPPKFDDWGWPVKERQRRKVAGVD